jgi:predicted ATPase
MDLVSICKPVTKSSAMVGSSHTIVEAERGHQRSWNRLDDRRRLLTSGRRTALPRHHTMSAALDWSYGLLAEAEQKVLRVLRSSPAMLGHFGSV